MSNFLLYIKNVGLIKFSLSKFIEKFLYDSAILLNGMWKPITRSMHNYLAFIYQEYPKEKKNATIHQLYPFRGKAIEIDYIYKSKPEYQIHQFNTIIAPLLAEQLIFTIATLGLSSVSSIFPRIKTIKLFPKKIAKVPEGMETYYITEINQLPPYTQIKASTLTREGHVYRAMTVNKAKDINAVFKEGLSVNKVQYKTFCGSMTESSQMPSQISNLSNDICFAETAEGTLSYLTGEGYNFSQKLTQSKNGFRILVESKKIGTMQSSASGVITSAQSVPASNIKNIYIFNRETQALEKIERTTNGFKLGKIEINLN